MLILLTERYFVESRLACPQDADSVSSVGRRMLINVERVVRMDILL